MTETTSDTGAARTDSTIKIISVLFTCSIYVVLSGGLINFNKYLVHKGRFPHPMQLTACHMLGGIILSGITYLIRPSMMPAMKTTQGKKLTVYKYLIPVGGLFAIMLFCSNSAYIYCSVAFLQFMKEANIILVFCISCLVGLQQVNRQRIVVIAWIILGSALCVSGDVHFALMGFIFQLCSQFAECSRAVLNEIVLNGDLKLDPLTYTLLVSPVCLVVLVIGSAITWNSEVIPDFVKMWPWIIPNSCLAFLLNVWIYTVIQTTSAVGFIITGVVKDIVLVAFSAAVFTEHEITTQQWICFMVTLSGVFFWSLMKVAPQHTSVKTFEALLCVQPRKDEPSEITPIAKKV
jgi:drug/metabolite transporter (DMT)-like permease